MLPTQINGLPAHVLLIHVVIIFVPLAALLLVLSAVWPAARRKLGFITPLVAAIALVAVPITTHAGEWLKNHLPKAVANSPGVRKHTQLGHELLPWVIGLFILAVVVWLLSRHYEMAWRSEPNDEPSARSDDSPSDAMPGDSGSSVRSRTATATVAAPAPATRPPLLPMWASIVIAVLAIGVSVGSVVEVYRIGDAGAHAVWDGTTSNSN